MFFFYLSRYRLFAFVVLTVGPRSMYRFDYFFYDSTMTLLTLLGHQRPHSHKYSSSGIQDAFETRVAHQVLMCALCNIIICCTFIYFTAVIETVDWFAESILGF